MSKHGATVYVEKYLDAVPNLSPNNTFTREHEKEVMEIGREAFHIAIENYLVMEKKVSDFLEDKAKGKI